MLEVNSGLSIQRKLSGISRLDKDIAEDLLGVADEFYPKSVELLEERGDDDKEGGVL